MIWLINKQRQTKANKDTQKAIVLLRMSPIGNRCEISARSTKSAEDMTRNAGMDFERSKIVSGRYTRSISPPVVVAVDKYRLSCQEERSISLRIARDQEKSSGKTNREVECKNVFRYVIGSTWARSNGPGREGTQGN